MTDAAPLVAERRLTNRPPGFLRAGGSGSDGRYALGTNLTEELLQHRHERLLGRVDRHASMVRPPLPADLSNSAGGGRISGACSRFLALGSRGSLGSIRFAALESVKAAVETIPSRRGGRRLMVTARHVRAPSSPS